MEEKNTPQAKTNSLNQQIALLIQSLLQPLKAEAMNNYF